MKLQQYISSRTHIRHFSQELAEKCGKSASYIERDILRAKKLNHISLNEYEWTAYCDLNDAQKASVSTLWTRAQFRKSFTDRRYISILMNKYIFSKVFSDFYGRRCILAKDCTEQTLTELAGDCGRLVVKPGCKGQGKGVRVLPCGTKAERAAALEYIHSIKNGIVEEYICQHEDIARLNPNAVSIIRFYSLSSPRGSYLFAPVLTVANKSDISNGCRDALTAMIDIKSGKVITNAVDQNKLIELETHPVTGVAFKGLQIPYWEQSIAMMRRAQELAGKISNIGWDLAISQDGPLIIEANTIPGFNTAQYHGFGWITGGYGYQPLFDEGMKGKTLEDMKPYERVAIKLD